MKVIIILPILLLFSPILLSNVLAQNLPLSSDFETTVFKIGGVYYAKDSQNDIISSSDTPDVVIKTALDRAGEIYISGGTYVLTNNFSGFDLKSDTHLKLSKDAYLAVPSGYAGYVFKLTDGVAHCIIEGGNIFEVDPIKRNWIGIMMQGGSNGVFFNTIENMIIANPQIVIDFSAVSGQWINANTFVNIIGQTFVTGIEFDFKGKHTDGSDGFSGNIFRDLEFQADNMTKYGVRDIMHRDNAFYSVYFWDLPSTAISSTIDSAATNTIIIGGRMTDQGFVDEGTNTIIVDALHNNIATNSTIGVAIMGGIYELQVNIPYQQSNQILKIDVPQQQSVTGIVRDNIAQLSIHGSRPALVNLYGIIANPSGGNVILHIIKPDGIANQNQVFVKPDGTFQFPISFDHNSLKGTYLIHGIYNNSTLGTLLITLTSNDIITNESTSNLTNSLRFESNTTHIVQVKDQARLWAQQKISDNSFGSSIQYLISIGIIKKPMTTYTHMYIPSWLRNDANLWSEGQITSSDFISLMQYLINNNVIQLSATHPS